MASESAFETIVIVPLSHVSFCSIPYTRVPKAIVSVTSVHSAEWTITKAAAAEFSPQRHVVVRSRASVTPVVADGFWKRAH